MIHRLRRNFIIVAMCSTFTVLAVIIGIANALNYRRVVYRADNLLEILSDNNAVFPKDSFMDKPGDGKWGSPGHGSMSPETPYETRFFSVNVDSRGETVSTDTGHIAAVDASDASGYAKEALESGKQKGFSDDYRYQIFMREEGSLIIFVDCGRDLEVFHSFAAASTSISAAGFLAVFVLVFIFSKKVFRPVADSYERQRRFITDASHELKTPVAVIAANIDVLELEGSANDWTASIRRQTDRIAALTEQMVALSRMDEGDGHYQMVDFSISDAVTETLETFLLPAENLGKKIEMHVGEHLSYHGDEDLIRQMVSLLIDNALKYSSDREPVKAVLRRDGRHLKFTMWNPVEQIQQGDLGILFERFYRLDASRSSETGGSGIGLSIAKAVAEIHGGQIAARSDDGTSFVVTVKL